MDALLAYLYYLDQTERNHNSLIAFELLLMGYKYEISLFKRISKLFCYLSLPTNWYEPVVAVKYFKFPGNLKLYADELKMKAIKVMKE